MRSKDHTGLVYGNWTALEYRGHGKSNKIMWLCRCMCGVEKVVRIENITNGHVKSCGCSRAKHGMHLSSEYVAWQNMKSRCNNPGPRHSCYKNINYCKRWESFSNFLADMGKKPGKEYTLERIDNKSDYHPNNCRWATPWEQAQNRSNTHKYTYKNNEYTISELAMISGHKHATIRERLNRYNWSVEDAVELPLKQ